MSTSTALARSSGRSVAACSLALLAGLMFPAGAKADDWPSFGIDATHAGASAERSGPAFRAGSWKYSATSSLWNTSSPAIADGIVVFGLRDGTVQAMRASTGRQLWQLKTTDSIVASPAIRQGRVFVSSLDGKLYALRLADGAVVWTKTLGGLEQASPTVVGDSLIVAGGSPSRKVFRIDTATGQTIWETSPSVMVQFSNSPVASDGDQVIVGAMQGHLYSFDFATGALRWTYEADGIVNLSAPVIVGGRVYLLPGGDSQSLHAVDLASGKAVPGWPVQLPPPSPDGGLAGTRINRSLAVSSLTSVDGRLLFDVRFDDAFDTDKDGIADQWLAQEFVMAASADDGHILWRQGNGRAVLQSPNDLPKNWLCPTPAAYQSATPGSSYLAVGSSLLATLKTLDAASGVTRGSITIDAPSRVSPAVANGRIFVGTESGVFQSNLSSTNQPPDVPTLKGTSGRAVGPNNTLVQWGAALDPEGDSVSYQVRVDHDAEILESWEAEVTTGAGVTSVRLPRPLQAGLTYAAAVRARDANGAWSSWSALQFFQVVETPQISVDGAPLAAADLASALAGAAVGSVVHLDPGTFHLSETMRIPAGVTLEGAGAGQTILDATGQAIGISLDGSVDGTPTEIRNLTVAGAKVGIAVGATHGARMRNVIVRDNWDAGVDVSAAGTAEMSQATLAANGCAVRSFGTITVKNSIVVGNQIGFEADHAGALASQYNDLTGNPVPLRGMSSGPHDLSSDVTFTNYPKRDLHVTQGQASTDQGDPADDASQEPAPNGGRVNLGAFGGTPEAELSAAPSSVVATVPGAASRGSNGCSVGAGTSSGAGLGWGMLGSLGALVLTTAALWRRRRRHAPAPGRTRARRLAIVLGAVLLICSRAGTASAAACTWNQGGTQNFSGSTGYWSCGHIPTSADDVVFSGSGIGNCNINASISVLSVSINSGYTGTVTQSSGQTITTSGAFSFGASSTGKFVGGNRAINVGTSFSMLGAAGSAFTSTSDVLQIGGVFTKTGGTFTAGTGRVLLSSTAASNTFATSGATFNDLYINDGLVGYWKLDEAFGTTVADASGNGNDGTLTGNPTWVTGASLPTLHYTDAAGLSLSGTGQYATLGVNNMPDISGPLTIAFWLYYASIPSTNQNAVVVTTGTGAAGTSKVQICIRNSALVATRSGGNILATASSTPASGWHHVAYSYNGTTHSLYVDGGTPATSTAASDSGSPNTVYLGTYNAGSELLAGRLDDVRVYNRVLNATEIASLAAGNQPGTGVATQIVTGNPTVNGDLVISSGTLAAGNTTITVGNNWLNDGGIFTTGTTSVVILNGSATGQVIRTSGYDFNSLTISGTGSWSVTDPASMGMTIDNDLTISNGTLTSTAGLLTIGGSLNRTGGTFTPNGGTVMLTATTAKTFAAGSAATFNNLVINDGLVGYWKLDETSGTTAADSSGNGYSGTYTNSPTNSSTTAPVSFADARSVALNGTSQCVQLANPTAMNITGPITMSAWVYNTNSTGYNDILVHGYTTGPSAAVYLRIVSGSYDCGTWTGGGVGTDYHTTSAIPGGDLNAWVHLACTYDGTAWNLYRNGAPVNSFSTATAPVSVAGNWAIGARGTCGERWFHGSIDDVRLYNRALSPTEISGLGIGNQAGTASATYTMTGSATIAGDLVIASGMLAAGTSSISLGGNWLNYGGLFTAGSAGLVTLNGSTSGKVIQSAGQAFGNLTVNGTGGSWTLNDRLELNPASTLTMTAGTLSLSSYTFRGGNLDNNGVALTTSTGKVVLDGSASATTDQGSFNDLRVEPVSATNLVGYWKLDDGQGATARDFSGNANDGTLTSGPLWVDTGLPSAISFDNPAALTFSGASSQYVTTASPLPAVLQPAVVTMAGWYKATTVDAGGPGAEIVSGSDRYSIRVINNTSVKVIKRTATSTWVALAGTVSNALDGSWHHLAGAISSSGMTLYFDGVSVASNADTTAIDYGATGLVGLNIGRDPINASYDFTGTIDDVRIYNVALTAAQIAALAAGRYPAGLSGAPTYTLGASATVSGNFGLDSGTLATSSLTFSATSAGATAYVNSGTYSVGSAASTFSGGLTVRSPGTLDLSTSGGAVKIGSSKVLTVDGTLSASSTGATIQSSAGTYSFQVGSTSAATPTLNISGLAVKNTDSNGMYVNAVSGSTTTFTQFDNIAFSAGTTGGRLLQIYASSLNLVSNGCSFDSGVAAASKTTAYNVTLRGDGSATETRAVFGNATCFSGNSPSYALCETYDDDDDANNDGVGDNAGSNAAVVQWIHSGKVDTNGTIEGFPTTAFDWNTFTYYSTYVVYHDVDGGTADRLYVRDTNGNAKSGYATPYWTGPTGEDIVGTPRFDTVSSVHYVYLATSAGHVYRLIDNTGAGTLTNDSSGNWAGANNPYNCSCTITTPLALDTNNLYWGGTASGNKVWTLGKTSRALAGTSPVTVTNVISGATPALWTSGDTYIFMGSAATFYKVDVTAQTLTSNNASPTGNVNGRISVINNKVYGADNAGSLWVLDPSNITTPLWSYHDNTNHSGCTSGQTCAITSSLYVDPSVNRAFYGDSDGHLYASYNSTGTTGAQWTTGYPFRPGPSTDVYATAPLYLSGILVAGTTTGSLYLIDVNGGSGPVLKQTYQFGSSTKVSGIAYDRGSGSYMISTSNASVKDGKLVYIDAIPDPTSTFN